MVLWFLRFKRMQMIELYPAFSTRKRRTNSMPETVWMSKLANARKTQTMLTNEQMHTVPSERLANHPGSMCEKWVRLSQRSFLGLHSSTVVNDEKLYMDVYGSLSCKDCIQAAEVCAVSTKQIIPSTGPLFIATESVLVLPSQTNLKTWLPGSL